MARARFSSLALLLAGWDQSHWLSLPSALLIRSLAFSIYQLRKVLAPDRQLKRAFVIIPIRLRTSPSGERRRPASSSVLTAARRHGLRLARRSGPRVSSQHPSHDCAQEKVAPQRLPEVAVGYGSGHERVGHEQREAPYSE